MMIVSPPLSRAAALRFLLGSALLINAGWEFHRWAGLISEHRFLVAIVLALRTLAWPGLIMGRLGLSYTSIFVPIVMGLMIYWSIQQCRRAVQRSGFGSAVAWFLPWALYIWVGWFYVFVFPVPGPVYVVGGRGIGPTVVFDDARAYSFGYRLGMIDVWDSDLTLEAFGRGQAVWHAAAGYGAGVQEWEALAPAWIEGSLILHKGGVRVDHAAP